MERNLEGYPLIFFEENYGTTIEGMPELLLHYKDTITEGITRSHKGSKNRNENKRILMLYREKATPSYKLQIIDRRGAPIHPKSEIFTTSS